MGARKRAKKTDEGTETPAAKPARRARQAAAAPAAKVYEDSNAPHSNHPEAVALRGGKHYTDPAVNHVIAAGSSRNNTVAGLVENDPKAKPAPAMRNPNFVIADGSSRNGTVAGIVENQ